MRQPLIIVGAGGFAKEVYSWVDHTKQQVMCFFTEETYSERYLYDVPILSSLEEFRWCSFIVAIGDNETRRRLFKSMCTMGFVPSMPIIHRSVVLGHRVDVGFGSIICPNSVVTSDVRIGSGCIVNIGTTIGHDVQVSDFVNIAPGVNVSGNVLIREGASLGTNSSVREHVEIGEWSTVGMGSVVLKDVPNGQTHIGNPARQLPVQSVP